MNTSELLKSISERTWLSPEETLVVLSVIADCSESKFPLLAKTINEVIKKPEAPPNQLTLYPI